MENDNVKQFLKTHPATGNLYQYRFLQETLWKMSGDRTTETFDDFVQWLTCQEQAGYLKPYKKQKKAGTSPDCWLTYRVKEVKPLLQSEVERFFAQHHPWLQTGEAFYRKQTDVFLKDQSKLLQLHQQLVALNETLEEPKTVNQWAYELVQHEKLLNETQPDGLSADEQHWRAILTQRLKWTSQSELFYRHETFTLPMVYEIRREPQTHRVLILENYDPFWTLICLYRNQPEDCPYDALVWGHGKLIESSFRHIQDGYFGGVFQSPKVHFDYAGDLDIEGIQIYRRLHQRYPNLSLSYLTGYADALLEKEFTSPTLVATGWRQTQQRWQPQWEEEWLEDKSALDFLGQSPQQALGQLKQGKLLPQERLTQWDWSRFLNRMKERQEQADE